jgi:hypothetical protein
LMDKYGLKSPKRFTMLEQPALDTNRLEGFREKFGLLQDLVRQSGIRATLKRGTSMTMTHWTVRDASRFDVFVRTVKLEVDGLIALMGVKEQVDRGMRTDIKALGWHPDLAGPVVRQDWEKLRLIREAVAIDYPEYVEVAENALKYIKEELMGSKLADKRAELKLPPLPAPTPAPVSAPSSAPASRRNSSAQKSAINSTVHPIKQSVKTPDKEKRPGFLSAFRFKSWSKNSKTRSKNFAQPTSNEDPHRSLSADMGGSKNEEEKEEDLTLEPVRSKSMSAMPDGPAPLDLDTKLHTVATHEDELSHGENRSTQSIDIGGLGLDSNTRSKRPEWDREALDGDWHALTHADTANSLIERHDMYKDVGRIETRDIRDKSKEAAGV